MLIWMLVVKTLKMNKRFLMKNLKKGITQQMDDHQEESNIEVDQFDGDDDNNMQAKLYKPPAFNSKKRKVRHAQFAGVSG